MIRANQVIHLLSYQSRVNYFRVLDNDKERDIHLTDRLSVFTNLINLQLKSPLLTLTRR